MHSKWIQSNINAFIYPTGGADSCEKGVDYFIDGQTCIAWGDPHTTTFNGEIHDFQGQMNSGKKRFYYVTPCAGYNYDDMPFSIIANHESWAGRQVSGIDYITLYLYESATESYSVFISGSILGYAQDTDDSYDDVVANGNLISITSSPITFGTRFSLTYTQPNANSINGVLTIDDECTVRFNMYGQYYYSNGRWRMHRMEILPLDCYQCMVCGLCGGYKTQRGAWQLETCNGGSVSFSSGWSANNQFAWDLDGNTWEKEYRDDRCPIGATLKEPNTTYVSNITNFTVEDPCDANIKQQVINACQTARDAASCCDEDLCDEMQAGCELDACVVANGDSTAVDDAVQEAFTDNVVGVCTNPTVSPTLNPTNTEAEPSGCTSNSDCGDNATCDTASGGKCSCNVGFRGDPDTNIQCTEINECEDGDPCGSNSQCTNLIGGDPGYTCSCDNGYESLTGDGKDCTDIDECSNDSDNNCPEICINNEGSYSCACHNPAGDINNDGSVCMPAVDCTVSNWSYGECSKVCGGGTQQGTRNITAEAQYGGDCNYTLSQIIDCNTNDCCADGDIKTFNWDTLTGQGIDIPQYNVTTFDIDENDLSLEIVVELDYLGDVTADDRRVGLFGVTYVLDFEDFDAHKDNIREPGTCQNRNDDDFSDTQLTWSDYWEFSNEPQNPGGIGEPGNFLAYPPPMPEIGEWDVEMGGNGLFASDAI